MKKNKTFFMRTGLLTALIIALTIGMTNAQTDSVYTLEKCIAYALKNSSTIQNAELDAAIAKAQVGEYRSIGLPQVNGQVQIVDNPTLQRMFLNNGGFYNDPSKPLGTTVAVPNLFQQRTSGDANATLTQLIFSGSYFIGLKAAKALSELSQKNTTLNKTQLVENVTKAFYMVIISKERISILDANLERLDTLFRQTKAMNSEGFVEGIDVDRLEVTYNNTLREKEKNQNIIDLSLILLKFQMGYEIQKGLTIGGSITDLEKAEALTTVTKVDYNNRIEYQLLGTQKKLEAYNLKNIRSGYLPTLSAFGKVGEVRMDKNIGEVFSNKWYPYTMWGVTLAVPIFDSFGKYHKAQQSKLAIQKINNTIINFENAVDLQVQQSEIMVKNSFKSLEIQKKNIELAKRVSYVTKIKYNQGIGSNLEVVTAESAYKEAQTNYYNALYDLMIYQIDYKKALGILYTEK